MVWREREGWCTRCVVSPGLIIEAWMKGHQQTFGGVWMRRSHEKNEK